MLGRKRPETTCVPRRRPAPQVQRVPLQTDPQPIFTKVQRHFTLALEVQRFPLQYPLFPATRPPVRKLPLAKNAICIWSFR